MSNLWANQTVEALAGSWSGLGLIKPTWEDSGLAWNRREELRDWMTVVQICGAKNANDGLKAFGSLKVLETLELRNLKAISM